MPKKAKKTEIQQKEIYIQSLRNGVKSIIACRAAGLSRSYVWWERQRDPEFNKQVEEALESRTEIVEDALYMNAIGTFFDKANVLAQIFWLKNRGKGKWKDKQEMEVIIPKTVYVKAFIQAGEEPVIKEEDPEKEINENNEENPREEIETVL